MIEIVDAVFDHDFPQVPRETAGVSHFWGGRHRCLHSPYDIVQSLARPSNSGAVKWQLVHGRVEAFENLG